MIRRFAIPMLITSIFAPAVFAGLFAPGTNAGLSDSEHGVIMISFGAWTQERPEGNGKNKVKPEHPDTPVGDNGQGKGNTKPGSEKTNEPMPQQNKVEPEPVDTKTPEPAPAEPSATVSSEPSLEEMETNEVAPTASPEGN